MNVSRVKLVLVHWGLDDGLISLELGTWLMTCTEPMDLCRQDGVAEITLEENFVNEVLGENATWDLVAQYITEHAESFNLGELQRRPPTGSVERVYPNQIFVGRRDMEVDGELHVKLDEDGLILDFWPAGEDGQFADEPLATNSLDLPTLSTICQELGDVTPLRIDDPTREFGVTVHGRPNRGLLELGLIETDKGTEVARIVVDQGVFSEQNVIAMINAYNAHLKVEHDKQQRTNRRLHAEQQKGECPCGRNTSPSPSPQMPSGQ